MTSTDTAPTCPDGDCPSVGRAPRLERYAAFETTDGDLVVYDVEHQGRWIQADVYLSTEESA